MNLATTEVMHMRRQQMVVRTKEARLAEGLCRYCHTQCLEGESLSLLACSNNLHGEQD